jgi:aminoglycoside phosphotransferase (APT) family kinase protein
VEENWGRISALVQLEPGQINEMLRPVLAGRKVVTAEVLTSGHANTNYRLHLSDSAEALVLRLFTRDPTACRKEYSIFAALHSTIPMAEILYIEPDPAVFGFAYSLNKFVEGTLLENLMLGGDDRAIAPVARELGKVLASLSAYRFEQPGLLDPELKVNVPFASNAESWLSFIENCLFKGYAGRHLGETRTAQLWQYVKESYSRLAALTQEISLVHADFKGSNILVRSEEAGWRVAAVLDWEFAYAGSYLSDVATLLRYRSRLNPAFVPNFAAGFEEQGHKLPDDWQRAAHLLDLLNLCDFLNRPQPDQAMSQEIIKLITETLTE